MSPIFGHIRPTSIGTGDTVVGRVVPDSFFHPSVLDSLIRRDPTLRAAQDLHRTPSEHESGSPSFPILP